MNLHRKDVDFLRQNAEYWQIRADQMTLDTQREWCEGQANAMTRAADVYAWVLDVQAEVEA